MPYKSSDGRRTWSQRYYATFHKPAQYYDLGVLSVLDNVPDETALHPLSSEEWESRRNGSHVLSKHVYEGVLCDYEHPQTPVHEVAGAILQRETSEALRRFIVFGDDIPESWQSYLQQLRDISRNQNYDGPVPERPQEGAPE